MDVLTEVLRAVRLRGTVYFHAEFRAPWGMNIKGGKFANFHIVVDGDCWLSISGQEFLLAKGDLVVFPHGAEHAIAHASDALVVPAEQLLSGRPLGAGSRLTLGGDGPTTKLICGHFEYDAEPFRHPLVASLPRSIHLRRGEGPNPDWIATAVQLTGGCRSDG